MTTTDETSSKASAFGLSRIIRFLFRTLWFFFRFVVCAWASLAIYFSNLPWEWSRLVLAVAFAIFGIWALWLSRNLKVRCSFVGLFLGVVIWFISISPSHDRPWRREVAVMPRVIINEDQFRITGYRNFVYRKWDDFDVNYEEREVLLSHLTSVDLYISYWKEGPVAHTLLSFNFDNANPVCVSIETRPEVGEGFAPIGSMFKQFELIYVVGDELDLIRSRTNYRNEEVYLYHIKSPPEAVRRLFMVYTERINELADGPEWYHLLKNNCTLNIVRYKNAAGREGSFDIRHLLNGWVDRYFYDAGMLDTSMPFEELRKKSHINKIAEATDGDISSTEFSRRIRESLPGMDLKAFQLQADPADE